MRLPRSLIVVLLLAAGCVVQLQPEPPLDERYGDDDDWDGEPDGGGPPDGDVDVDSDVDSDVDADSDADEGAEDLGFAATSEAEVDPGADWLSRGWRPPGRSAFGYEDAPTLPDDGYHGEDAAPNGDP